MSLSVAMALVAGVAVGVWLVVEDFRKGGGIKPAGWILMGAVAILGGLSVVGPPLLMLQRRRSGRRRPWGAGKVLWFSQGMAGWLLWPPVVYRRIQGEPFNESQAGICYAYGTPLMALYVTSALLAGGWLGRGRRRRLRRSWAERFGLVLALLWACTGLYVLYLLYSADIFGRQ